MPNPPPSARSAIPKRSAILRGVLNDSRAATPLPEKPVQVWTLIDEEGFLARGLVHNQTAFIEDTFHDWDWSEGALRFYGHSGSRGELHDLVVVFER